MKKMHAFAPAHALIRRTSCPRNQNQVAVKHVKAASTKRRCQHAVEDQEEAAEKIAFVASPVFLLGLCPPHPQVKIHVLYLSRSKR